jgi:5-methylcytosine-specific restriction endonuclease McrA
VTASTVPDHIVPLAKGGTDDEGNIQCLCGPCHDIKTREDFDLAPAVEGRGVGRSGRPTSPDHPWNRDRPRDSQPA